MGLIALYFVSILPFAYLMSRSSLKYHLCKDEITKQEIEQTLDTIHPILKRAYSDKVLQVSPEQHCESLKRSQYGLLTIPTFITFIIFVTSLAAFFNGTYDFITIIGVITWVAVNSFTLYVSLNFGRQLIVRADI